MLVIVWSDDVIRSMRVVKSVKTHLRIAMGIGTKKIERVAEAQGPETGHRGLFELNDDNISSPDRIAFLRENCIFRLFGAT